MLMTAAAILILLAALLSGLRNGFYALHVLAVCLVVFLYEHTHGSAKAFTVDALWVFFVIHLVSINLITCIAYGYDKSAARAGKWRVKEKSLHAMSFAGGTFGAFAGQKIFRHKTRKHSFRIVFWLTGWMQIVLTYVFWVMSR